MDENVLRQSDVVFEPKSHTYMRYGQPLKGVTPIVKWMFPDTYLGIPDEVLKKAADYGHLIHSKIEMYDQTGIQDEECEPLKDYIALVEKYGMKAFLNEYLVDDGQNIASSIDIVFGQKDGGWPLGDIKTTSKIHVNNVRLQLSIYAWLFEMNNPGQKAGKLYVVWLPKPQYGVADLLELERVPSEDCERIVKAYLAGESSDQFQEMWDIGKVRKEGESGELPERYFDVETELIDILEKEKELAERKEELKQFLMCEMTASDARSWSTDRLRITKKAGGVRQSVDSKKLKEEHPDIYVECLKNTNFKECIEVKLK